MPASTLKTITCLFLFIITGCSLAHAQTPSFSFDWKQLKLAWPLYFTFSGAQVYDSSGTPYLYPTKYTMLAGGKDYMGNPGGHNGIDITLNDYRLVEQGTAKVYAAATGVLVGYRDYLIDRVNNPALWKNFTPANQFTVTQLAPSVRNFGIQNIEDGSGNVVYLQHANGFVTQYAHLKQGLNVTQWYQLGDTVPAGTLLGSMGSSGASSSPHLHFGLYTGPQSLQRGAGVAPGGRISPYRSDQGWGYYVCPFYRDTIGGVPANMWTGVYDTIYMPHKNAAVNVFDLAVSGATFLDNAPPPNTSVVLSLDPIYLKAYTSGARAGYALTANMYNPFTYFSTWKDTLKQDSVLLPYQKMASKSGGFYAQLNPSGVFTVYRKRGNLPDSVMWASPAPPASLLRQFNSNCFAQVSANGLFCTYAGTPSNKQQIWCSSPLDTLSGTVYAKLGDDGNFCVYKNNRAWCDYKYIPGMNSSALLTPILGTYQVNAFSIPPDTPPARPNSFTNVWFDAVSGGTAVIDTLVTSQGPLMVGDFYNSQTRTESPLQFTVYLHPPKSPFPSPLQYAKISMPLTGTTGTNPFSPEWGATLYLTLGAPNGWNMAYFSPVKVSGNVAEAIVVYPGILFNPNNYSLSAWPAAGVPLTVSFNVPVNNNGKSDNLTFGNPVTIKYYYGGTTQLGTN